jgi:hypothetical protein
MSAVIQLPVYPTAEWGGEGHKPPATHWYWSIGDIWIAVVEAWEQRWWEGCNESELATRPDPWYYPIDQIPPSGVLRYERHSGELVSQDLVWPPPTRDSVCRQTIEVEINGGVIDWEDLENDDPVAASITEGIELVLQALRTNLNEKHPGIDATIYLDGRLVP